MSPLRCSLSLSLALVLAVCLSRDLARAGDEARFSHEASGISLAIPAGAVHDKAGSKDEPLRVAFRVGEPPFAVYVRLKELAGEQTLADFVKHEKARQKEGGYEGEVKVVEHEVDGQKVVEFVRTTKHGTIYYAGFASRKQPRVYTLHHMTSEQGDPKHKGLAAYRAILASLRFAQE